MALQLNNDALIVGATGTIYVAPENTPLPSEGFEAFAKAMMPGAPAIATPWERLANTSRDSLPSFAVEAGDTTQLGSWDNDNIRTIYGNSTITLTIRPMQIDGATISRIANGWEIGTDAVLPASGWATTGAIVVCILDGLNCAGYYIPANDINFTGMPELALDAFAEMEIVATAKPAAAAALAPDSATGRAGLIRMMPPRPIAAPTPPGP